MSPISWQPIPPRRPDIFARGRALVRSVCGLIIAGGLLMFLAHIAGVVGR